MYQTKLEIDLTQAKKNPGESFKFKFNFLPDNGILNNSLAVFEKEAEFYGSYFYNGSDVYTEGKISYFIKYPCDRCLSETIFSQTVNFKEVYFKHSEDADDYKYSGDTVDLYKAAEEYIILNLPNGIICGKKCKGLCPYCGKNLNIESCNCKGDEEVINPFSVLK